jgi:type 2 lantibiotic biosynthesis protein LanM
MITKWLAASYLDDSPCFRQQNVDAVGGIDRGWENILASIAKRPEFHSAISLTPIPGNEALSLPFVSFVEPFLHYARERWAKTITDLRFRRETVEVDRNSLVNSLLVALGDQLHDIASRVLAMELHIADLKNEVTGQTASERLRSFAESKLRDPQFFWAALEEYPVLGRLLATRTLYWIQFSLEALNHFVQHYPKIQEIVDGTFGKLVEVRGGASDPHNRGRCVLFFESDSNRMVVYKPRSMAVDVCVQSLLSYLNEQGFPYPFYIQRILDCEDCGWVPYFEPMACQSVEEVQRFFFRQGAYLAIWYLLDGNDFHAENVIAHGEHPLYIDVETLFQTPFYQFDSRTAEGIASQFLSDSPLRTGLLPVLSYPSEGQPGVELSGLGGDQSDITYSVEWLDTDGDDLPIFRRSLFHLPPFDNLPMLGGKRMRAVDFLAFIEKGFEWVYRFFVERKQELTGQGGILNRFRPVRIRYVIRSTQHYYNFLQAGNHPDYLQSGRDREMLLDRLYLGTTRYPLRKQFVPHEKRELLHGDIPLFTTQPDSRDVRDAQGTCVVTLSQESGWERVLRRLDLLGEEDLAKSLAIIRNAILSTKRERVDVQGEGGSRQGTEVEVRGEDVLGCLRGIANHLVDQAFLNPLRTEATWIGFQCNRFGQWSYDLLDGSLSDGLVGLSLLLVGTGMMLNEGTFIDTGLAAFQTVLGSKRPVRRADVLYGSMTLYRFLGDVRYAEWAREQAGLLIREVRENRLENVVSLFEAAKASACFWEADQTEAARTAVNEIAERLYQKLQQDSQGKEWVLPLAKRLERLGAASPGSLNLGRPSLWNLSLWERLHVLADSLRLEGEPSACFETGEKELLALQSLHNDGYASGTAGAVEALLLGGQCFNEPDCIRQAARLGQALAARKGWTFDSPSPSDTPGLYRGVSGIGYALLRSSFPEKVPPFALYM